ncbi:MAG: response regulator [Deltaproteobacteria bacterium]|nr:response regulator [Deltaproteobacteria bacterium]
MITKDSKSILVADDSIFFRTKLSDILVEAGHKVRFARNGREVLDEIKIDSTGLDLLILDLQMPDIDGFEVLKWMGENGYTGKFPVLVITGAYEPVNVMEKLRSYGASGLMTKGYTPEQIVFRVNRVLFPDKAVSGKPRERVPVSIAVDFTVGEARQTGYLLNISETGAFLHTKTDLPTGAMIRLKFSLPGFEKVIDVKGLAKWSTSEVASRTLFGGYGIMFTSVSDADLGIIRDFIAKESKKIGIDDEVSKGG